AAPARVSAAGSALRELLDVLLGERLQAGDETFHFPLGRMIGKDQLLRSRAVRDVCHPVVEVRCAAPRDGHPAESHTPSSLDLGEWFSATVHRSRSSAENARSLRPKTHPTTTSVDRARQTYECGLSRSRLRFSA